MAVKGKTIEFKTSGYSEIHDITQEVNSILRESGLTNGLVNIFVIGSTASVSTIEYEPALVEDMKEKLEQLISQNDRSRHSETWGDDNGFSHMRATLMGPGITVPFENMKMILGTWQQIIVIDHDNRPRKRKVHIQILGE